jgi:LacI family transcriptional regulator
MLAGGLRRKKTNDIGIILSNSGDFIIANIAKKISELLFVNEFNAIILNSGNDIEVEKENFLILKKKMVNGILVVPTELNVEHLKKMNRTGIPIIILDRNPNIGINSVAIDSFQGGFAAAEHFISLGHKIIGYIDRFQDHYHSLERKKGFFSALFKNNIPINEFYQIRCKGIEFEDGYDVAKILLETKDRPSAIFGYTDDVALGVLRACKDLGLKVPKNISVIGYNDLPISSFSIPRLTTIHYPINKVAKATVDLILSMIADNSNAKLMNISIPPRLVVRESTAELNSIYD